MPVSQTHRCQRESSSTNWDFERVQFLYSAIQSISAYSHTGSSITSAAAQRILTIDAAGWWNGVGLRDRVCGDERDEGEECDERNLHVGLLVSGQHKDSHKPL